MGTNQSSEVYAKVAQLGARNGELLQVNSLFWTHHGKCTYKLKNVEKCRRPAQAQARQYPSMRKEVRIKS